MKVCPAIVRVAVLCAPLFGVTEIATVPFPLPVEPLVIVTQGELLVTVADHAQLLVAVTTMFCVPPVRVKLRLVGSMLKVQAV